MPYVRDLKNVLEMEVIRPAGLKLAVDPPGGAALPYWELINSVFGLDITVVNPRTDPTFSFMMVDHEGWIRMGLFDVGRSQVKQKWLLRSHTHIFLLSRISVCSRTATTASC